MSLPYYIEGTTKLWIKDNLAPFGTNVYYIRKISGYVPNDKAIFDFHDNFDDNSIDNTKWFTDGVGTVSETGGTAYVVALATNKYPRYVTKIPLKIRNYMVEYDVKLTGAASESCRMGYTSYYVDGSELANWFLFFDGSKYLRFWTRINGAWALRWSYTTAVTVNTWYKIRLIEIGGDIKVQLLNSSGTLITESGLFFYDYKNQNSLYFGQRSTGDGGYWDNFKIRRYASIEPTVTVQTETDGYKVIVKNNINDELRDYQISVPASGLGTLTSSTSVCVDVVNRTPLRKAYHNTLYYSVLDIPDMTRDVSDTHTLTMYNSSKTNDRFNCINNATVFNGTSTRGVITHNTDLDIFNTNTFTLHIWLKQIGAYTSSSCILLSKASGTGANRWNLQISNNEVGFFIQDADSTLNFVGSYTPININDNSWHLVSFVRNGTNVLAYKDGVYIRSYALTNITNFSNTVNANIGCTYTTTYVNYFQGTYGEVKLFNNLSTNEEVLNYYNVTKTKQISKIIHGVRF